MKYTKHLLILAMLLIVAGGAFLLFYRDRQTAIVTPPPAPNEVTQAKAVAAAVMAQTPADTDVATVSGEPSRLSIPSLNINLAITPGVYNAETKQWTLTRDNAQYAVMTPEPNTAGGNTFIYGHYRKGVFATLYKIRPGEKAIVTTKDGKTFTYVFESSRTVAPERSEGIFDYQGRPILTLQTCAGVFFENRQLFTFNLESVS